MSRARNIAILLDGNGDVSTSALDNATTSLSDLGVTATATEINYVDGVTSNVQTQIDGKQNPLTAGTDYQTPLTAGTHYQTPLTAGQHYLTPTGDASQLTNLPAGYTDSDVATYLSNNGYDTATNIVASITDSAPATMDTLNELAAALGDDANFATTVTNSLAGKANLTGATFTGAVVFPSGANDPGTNTVGELFFNTSDGVFKFNDGSGWKKVSAVVALLNSVSGTITSGSSASLTLTGEGFQSSTCTVTFSASGISDQNVSVTASSDVSITVSVPSAVYNLSGGTVVTIKVTNSDGSTTGTVTTTLTYPKGSSQNPFTSVADAQSNGASEGLHYFQNSSSQTQQLYYDPSDGGWILVASNYSGSSTIPGSTSRHNLAYTLHRNGTNGHLGTPSPNNDYIIGNWYSNFSFSRCRVIGFGRNSTSTSYTWTNRGGYINAQWNTTSRNTITNASNVSWSGSYGIHGSASYFSIDGIWSDYVNGGFNANSNQTTVGGVGVANSNGDPANGCYMGHGNTEGSFEGWYDSGGGNMDSTGYTTWLR